MKKIIAALLLLVMVISLVACGNTPDNPDNPINRTDNTTAPSGNNQNPCGDPSTPGTDSGNTPASDTSSWPTKEFFEGIGLSNITAPNALLLELTREPSLSDDGTGEYYAAWSFPNKEALIDSCKAAYDAGVNHSHDSDHNEFDELFDESDPEGAIFFEGRFGARDMGYLGYRAYPQDNGTYRVIVIIQ